MHLAHYLGLLHKAQTDLAAAFREVAGTHEDEPDVAHTCETLARDCDEHDVRLAPFAGRYGEDAPRSPTACTRSSSAGRAPAPSDCCATCTTSTSWRRSATWHGRSSAGPRRAPGDEELLAVVLRSEQETAIQMKWLRTRMKQAAPQALVVAD